MRANIRTAAVEASFRRASEDRLAVRRAPGAVVVVVADGAGGVPGGARAAELVVGAVDRALAGGLDLRDPVACERLLRALDLEVEADRDAGETTAVIVAVSDEGRVAGASSGDSGALVVRADGTTDDLTAAQRRKRRVGSGAAAPVGFERARLEGTLVVASDGLLAYARPPVVAEVVLAEGDLEDAARALVDRVRLPRGALMDDVAIVLARGDPAR